MEILERQGDLSNVEQGHIVGEDVFLSQQSEDFSSLHEVEYKV